MLRRKKERFKEGTNVEQQDETTAVNELGWCGRKERLQKDETMAVKELGYCGRKERLRKEEMLERKKKG